MHDAVWQEASRRYQGRMLTITEQSPPPEAAPSPDALAEVSRLSLRLGLTAFGGPAAHMAMLRDEVVSRLHSIVEGSS